MKPKKPSKPAANSPLANPEIEHIEQLLRFMTEHNLEEFEYSQGDLRIRFKKPSGPSSRQISMPEIIVAGSPSPSQSAPPPIPPAAAPAMEPRSSEDLHLVKSPIVGTYYESPSPGSEPFAKIGGYVETGQTLCIVEAMKLMNEIEAEFKGKVVQVLVENAQPVEFGQKLFLVEPA
jgi:acetyl-CoA carboxylase biotin carboxyl carrier protein